MTEASDAIGRNVASLDEKPANQKSSLGRSSKSADEMKDIGAS